MQYILCYFIIGQLLVHHLYTACFIFCILTCSILIKRFSLMMIMSCVLTFSIGFFIEFHALTSNKDKLNVNTATNDTMIVKSIKFITLPISDKQGVTALVETIDKEKLQLKVFQPLAAPIPSSEFFHLHTCTFKGKYKPSNFPGQYAYFNVKSIHFQDCIPHHPNWLDNVRLMRNKYTENMLSSNILGKDKLIALATGNIQYINKDELTLIRQLGISHLFAVSGTHVGVLVGILYQILKRLPMPVVFAKLIVLLLLPCYLIFAGEAPSAQRAVLMTCIALIFSKLIMVKGISILAFVYIILTLHSPELHYHLGFQFSFTICFILLLMQKLYVQKPLINIVVLTSIISFYGTVPISYHHFNEVQWQGILTNLYFVPLYSLIIIPLAFITIPLALFAPFLLKSITFIIKGLFFFQNHLLHLSKPLANFHWVIPNYGEIGYCLLSVGCFISLYLLVQRRYKQLLCFTVTVVLFSLFYQPTGKNEMTLIDVGQGDAILFKTSNHQTLLIDTGGQIEHLKNKSQSTVTERKLYPTLKQKGVTHIDYVLITHAHADHMGELERLARLTTIRNIIINSNHFDRDKLQEVISVANDENARIHSAFDLGQLSLGDFYFQFLNATIPDSDNPNHHSVITLAFIHQTHILLMGDATIENEEKLLKAYPLPKINVLKVGHHGSLTSTSENFISKIKPEYALISSGKNNLYRLPHPEVLTRLKQHDVKTYNTADNQNLTIQFNINPDKRFQLTNAN